MKKIIITLSILFSACGTGESPSPPEMCQYRQVGLCEGESWGLIESFNVDGTPTILSETDKDLLRNVNVVECAECLRNPKCSDFTLEVECSQMDGK